MSQGLGAEFLYNKTGLALILSLECDNLDSVTRGGNI